MNDMTMGVDPTQMGPGDTAPAGSFAVPLEGADPTQEEMDAYLKQRRTDLLAAIRHYESDAIGGDEDDLSEHRAEALDYYLGRPMGNEIRGRSQVVSKDLFDTVEWIKPSLLRIFASGDQVVQFEPQNENDIKGAEQETDYVDYIIQRKNNWFTTAYNWITDALLLRTSYCMVYWENKTEPVLERYQGLTDDELAYIMSDPTVELVGHEAYQAPVPMPQPDGMLLALQGIQPPVMVFHNVEVRRSRDYGCAKICALPSERCLVRATHADVLVRESDFFEYWEMKPISDVRAMGYEVDDDISDADASAGDQGPVSIARDVTDAQMTTSSSAPAQDPSMREVKVRWIWVRFDFDGDGIAEKRFVMAIGDTVLANQECASTTVSALCPYPMPHRHVGQSLHDVMGDLQQLRTALLRQTVDNAFLHTNGRYGVDKNLVNLDDLSVSRPGGYVRVNGSPHNSIMPFVHPNTLKDSIGVMQYLDGIRQDRTGTSKPFAGADVDAIDAQPGTVAQLTNAVSQKIELIARIFADGVKDLFSIVHEVTLSNATVPDKVELRGKWESIDPRAWKKRTDMRITVGMGVINRQQHIAGIGALINMQGRLKDFGLTSPGKVYAAAAEFTKALGFSNGKQFFDEPPPGAKFQPAIDPVIVATQINSQAQVLMTEMKTNAQMAVEQLKQAQENARTYFETMIDAQQQAQDRFIRTVSELTERMQELRLEGVREGKAAVNLDLSPIGKALEGNNANTGAALSGITVAAEKLSAAADAIVAKGQGKRRITGPNGKVYVVEPEGGA